MKCVAVATGSAEALMEAPAILNIVFSVVLC